MRSLVEPRVRRLAAEHLGVAEEELRPELSLVEDLAADSLDIAELGLALEDELSLTVPESVLQDVRTYGDLVEALMALVEARTAAEARNVAQVPRVVARVLRDTSTRASGLERAGRLTPYLAETLADDVLSGGPGTRLEVTVTAEHDDVTVARVHDTFAWLLAHGVQLSVQRDAHRSSGHHPHAA